ncbi:NAD(P)-binding domain-containing protein, partial [bacterium]|nr:NAD(P)-binding domain-containing protein [bacterium]
MSTKLESKLSSLQTFHRSISIAQQNFNEITMSNLTADSLFQTINDQTAVLGVIGLGYVGLPLIDAYISAGFKAIGYDVDDAKADALNQGKSYIAHIAHEKIQSWLDKKSFEATTDMNRLSEADVILICVPTPLSDSRDPD